jgi:hypothetical protein
MVVLTDGRLCWTYICTSIIECTCLHISGTDSTCFCGCSIDSAFQCGFNTHDILIHTSNNDAICLSTSDLNGTFADNIDGIFLGTSGTDCELSQSNLQL